MTRLGTAGAAVLAAALAVGAWVAPAQAAPSAAAGTAAPSAPVTGTLFAANGQHAGAGRTVHLVAWPGQAVLERLHPGDRVPTVVVGSGTTDGSGGFAIHYSDTAAVRAYAGADGVTNLDVEATSAAGPSIFNITRPAPRATSTGSRAVVAPASTEPAIALRPVPGARPLSAHALASPDQGGCTWAWVYKSSYGTEQVQVGEGYTRSGSSSSFSYKSGSSSTLGVGVSASGSKGTFSASGTAESTSDSTESETPISGDKGVKWRTTFEYGKYAYKCVQTGATSSYEAKVRGFAGGASYIASTAPSSTSYCVSQSAGSSFTKDTTTAYTFGTGVDTSGDIGISLTSKTGWNGSTSLKYSFTKTLRLCGSAGYPAGSPHRIYVK